MTGTHVALVLPGSGYGAELPALRVPALALDERGADVRVAAYPDWRPDSLTGEAADRWVGEVVEGIRPLFESSEPADRVTVVAKSLGTLVLAMFPDAWIARCVWITPLFAHPGVERGATRAVNRSVIVAGTGDSAHDPDAHRRVVAATGAAEVLIDGANHSLEVPGDVIATVDGWRRLAAATLTM